MKRENIEILIAIVLLLIIVSVQSYYSIKANIHIISMFEKNQVNNIELQPNK